MNFKIEQAQILSLRFLHTRHDVVSCVVGRHRAAQCHITLHHATFVNSVQGARQHGTAWQGISIHRV